MSRVGKVFHIGFNKSGSTSLAVAMEILGFKSIHYWCNGKRLFDIVRENVNDRRPILDGFDSYDFFADFEGQLFLKELDVEYPNSKFILTIRELNDWLESRKKHAIRNQRNPNYKYDFLTVSKEKWKIQRENVLSRISNYFRDRPDDLLIIDICRGQGWETLCEFLSIPAPTEPFPHRNEASDG